MEKKRRPIWLRIIFWLLGIVGSFALSIGIACGFLYFKYEINVFEVISQIKILNEEVEVDKIASNSFGDTDMSLAFDVTETNLPGLITFNLEDGYKVTPEEVDGSLLGDLKFTDKQIGAILNNIIESQDQINVQLGSTVNLKDYGFKIVQVQFSNITETTTDFNVVIKIDLTKLKEESMNDFPLNIIKSYIPESLYFSATTTITKTANAFEYSTAGKNLRINNLTTEQTANIFKTINVLLKLGTPEEFAKTIGDTFVNALIGTEETPGIAYALKDAGATDFAFVAENENNYFVIKK